MLDQDCENLTDIPSPYFPLPQRVKVTTAAAFPLSPRRSCVAVGEGAGGEGQPQIYVRITVQPSRHNTNSLYNG